jgi:putative transposase
MPREAGRKKRCRARPARLQRFFDHVCDTVRVRTAYKCRAYPGQTQQQVLLRTFGYVRLVSSRTLAARHARWHLTRTGTSYAETDRALTEMKKDPDLAFLNEVSSVPLQQTLRHQHKALSASCARRARYPRFKSRCSRQSAHYTRCAFSMHGGELRLAKMNRPVRFVWTWPDVDVTALARCQRRLARYQRRLARCQHGSANRAKAAARVARAHRKVRDARRDFLHRTTTRLVRSADTIVIEDLNVSGMVRNRHLARAISDCGRGEFRRQLAYKCERQGRRLVVIDRWYPSSKMCSACGHVLTAWDLPGDARGADVRHSGSSRVRSAVKQEPQPVTAGIPVLRDEE